MFLYTTDTDTKKDKNNTYNLPLRNIGSENVPNVKNIDYIILPVPDCSTEMYGTWFIEYLFPLIKTDGVFWI